MGSKLVNYKDLSPQKLQSIERSMFKPYSIIHHIPLSCSLPYIALIYSLCIYSLPFKIPHNQ